MFLNEENHFVFSRTHRMDSVKQTAWRTGLLVLVICSSLGLVVGAAGAFSDSLTVVYNHIRGDSVLELQAAGGLSVFVEIKGKVILFDTGGETGPLLQNVDELGRSMGRLDAVVVSHNHWDHVDGLPGVLSVARDGPTVYVPESAREAVLRQNPRADVVAVGGSTQIMPGVWVVGPMQAAYRSGTISEQALVLDHQDGLIILVGCSHPGIVNIVERVTKTLRDKKIQLVAGGFHLRSTSNDEVEKISRRLQELGVTKLAPTHCTGDGAMSVFRRQWPDRLVAFDLGDTITF